MWGGAILRALRAEFNAQLNVVISPRTDSFILLP